MDNSGCAVKSNFMYKESATVLFPGISWEPIVWVATVQCYCWILLAGAQFICTINALGRDLGRSVIILLCLVNGLYMSQGLK